MTSTQENIGLRRLTALLTYAGAIPFISWPIALHFPQLISRSFTSLLPDYMLIIVSFMAGSLWGSAINAHRLPSSIRQHLMLAAIVLSLLPWAARACLSLELQIGLSIILFIILFGLDWWQGRLNGLPPWYVSLRLRITTLVCCSLLLTVLMSNRSL